MLRGFWRKFTVFFGPRAPFFLFPFPPVFVLLFFCLLFFCLSVFRPVSFFSVLLSFCLPFFCPSVFRPVSFFFCSFVFLSSFPPLVPYTALPARSCPAAVPLPFHSALYNIIRCAPFLRVLPALDLCQERRKVHDFCKIICRKVCRFRGKLYLCTRFRPEPGCEQQGKSSLKGLHETVE